MASLNRCMAWLRPRMAPALMIGGRLRLDGIIPLLERDKLVPLEFICLPIHLLGKPAMTMETDPFSSCERPEELASKCRFGAT